MAVPAIILVMATSISFLIACNWNTWVSGNAVQKTDDAYVQADLTPLSMKVAAGMVESTSKALAEML
jgi:membrane fusion protein, multidrug efflux system